jgi:hypothetical protein
MKNSDQQILIEQIISSERLPAEHRNVHIRKKRVLLSEYLTIKGTSESSVQFCATAYANDCEMQILPTMSTRKIKTIVAINWKKL